MKRRMLAGHGVALAAFALFLVFVAAPRAQPPARPTPSPAPGAPAAPATPAAKPLVPLAASTLAANPEPYYGENVTLSGAVEQSLTKTAFSVDQDSTKSTGKEILVLAPMLTSPVDLNAYVTVIGEVVKFDAAEIARKTKTIPVDLPPEVAAKYKGKPAILATSVINAAFVDLAKRLPPPLTADEENYQKVMRKVGPAFAALRTSIDGSIVDTTKQNAGVLKQAFVDTEAFWKARGKTDAVQWAQEARKNAESIEHGATTGEWEAVKTAAAPLGQSCATCHGAYRERFDDGSFRIKTSVK